MRLDESINAHERSAEAVRAACALLEPPIYRESVWPTLAAATFFATAALLFATAAVLAPSAQVTPPAVRSAL